jgi:hypothetical protein
MPKSSHGFEDSYCDWDKIMMAGTDRFCIRMQVLCIIRVTLILIEMANDLRNLARYMIWISRPRKLFSEILRGASARRRLWYARNCRLILRPWWSQRCGFMLFPQEMSGSGHIPCPTFASEVGQRREMSEKIVGKAQVDPSRKRCRMKQNMQWVVETSQWKRFAWLARMRNATGSLTSSHHASERVDDQYWDYIWRTNHSENLLQYGCLFGSKGVFFIAIGHVFNYVHPGAKTEINYEVDRASRIAMTISKGCCPLPNHRLTNSPFTFSNWQ